MLIFNISVKWYCLNFLWLGMVFLLYGIANKTNQCYDMIWYDAVAWCGMDAIYGIRKCTLLIIYLFIFMCFKVILKEVL